LVAVLGQGLAQLGAAGVGRRLAPLAPGVVLGQGLAWVVAAVLLGQGLARLAAAVLGQHLAQLAPAVVLGQRPGSAVVAIALSQGSALLAGMAMVVQGQARVAAVLVVPGQAPLMAVVLGWAPARVVRATELLPTRTARAARVRQTLLVSVRAPTAGVARAAPRARAPAG